jgi:predicted CoA-substrate-specific enzyme activase
MYIAALDIGSVATKGLLWSAADGEIRALASTPSAWQPQEAASTVLKELLTSGLTPSSLATTGYGRNLISTQNLYTLLPSLEKTQQHQFNEITALARAVSKVVPEVRLIMDVGGQDSKALSIDEHGRVVDFILNDKCAAGAGAFIDGVCQSFKLSHEDFGRLAETGNPAQLSSMCAVFAQTELVAQIARGVKRADLAAGILASLATRLKTQSGRLFTGQAVALTGGLSRLAVFTKYLANSMEAQVIVPPNAPYLAALGAALMAAEKA